MEPQTDNVPLFDRCLGAVGTDHSPILHPLQTEESPTMRSWYYEETVYVRRPQSTGGSSPPGGSDDEVGPFIGGVIMIIAIIAMIRGCMG